MGALKDREQAKTTFVAVGSRAPERIRKWIRSTPMDDQTKILNIQRTIKWIIELRRHRG